MEWTFGWWQSVQRVYPTTTQLSQLYNQAASWWHQHCVFWDTAMREYMAIA